MHSRRSVLAGTGAVLGTAALGGCSVLDSGGGGDGGSAGYTDWFYESDADSATFSVAQYAEVTGIDGLPEEFVPSQLIGIPIEDMDYAVNFGANSLYEGSFDADEFRSGLETEGELTLEADGELDGYDMYAVAGLDYRVALRDGRAVLGATDSLEQFLDAGAGEVDRLVDTNDDADEFTDELGTSHSVDGRVKLSDDASPSEMRENVVAAGQNVNYGTDTVEFRQVVLFETEDGVDEEAVRSDYEDNDDLSDLSSSSDGRLATVTYTRPMSDLV